MHGQAGVEERVGFKVALARVPGAYRYPRRQPSLGLSPLCAYLKAGGFECRVFDARYHSWTAYDLIKRIVRYRPHLVGLTAMTYEIKGAARLAGRLRYPQPPSTPCPFPTWTTTMASTRKPLNPGWPLAR